MENNFEPVDSWKEITVVNEDTGVDILEDKYTGENIIEETTEEKYLGDIISNDGRNIKNIRSRIAKGKGIVSKIISILDALPLGNSYFEIGLILRDSLLTSSILCNSETWYNITKAEMELLETVVTLLLQRILNAPKSTPKEMYYLELGCIPYRNLIQKKRLMFLFYILKQDPITMIYKCFESQKNHGTSKDWVNTVVQDLKDLNIDKNFEEIKIMKKHDFRRIVLQSIKKKAMQHLEDRKSQHSKVKHLKHEIFGMQKYLRNNNVKISIEEKQMIFKLRAQVTRVKNNF